MAQRVGIDLGTTFSAVAYIDEATGKPKIVKNHIGEKLTPSVLCFHDDGTILFGQEAKEELSIGNPNAVAFFKRSMGDKNFEVEFSGKRYNSEDLSVILLKNLKEDAERQLNDHIDSAVITVPAYFEDPERKATKNAGKRAGLNVHAIINEPTAAAYAYGVVDSNTKTILIYDLGGGTFDVTVARITNDSINCLGTGGDHALGGKDWDDTIVRYLVSEFESETGIDLRYDADMMASLLVTAENAKKQLSVRDAVSIPLKYQGERANVQLTIETFNAISSHLIQRTRDVIDHLLPEIKLSWRDIDGVILVGGSTRMRIVKDYVTQMCGKEPLSGVDVDEAVALGAAIRAHIESSGKRLIPCAPAISDTRYLPTIQGAKAVTDVIAHSLGVISISQDGDRYINEILIQRNSQIPVSQTQPFKIKTRSRNNEIEVYVLQGEEELPLANTILNKYVIYDIENVPSRESVVDITYRYSEEGFVEVSAVQKGTEKTLMVRMDAIPDDMSWVLGRPKDQVAESATQKPLVSVMFAIDVSGSMSGLPIEMAKQEMIKLVDELCDLDAYIGVSAFANSTTCLIKPTSNYFAVKSAINCLTSGYGNTGSGTTAEPFTLCSDALAGRFYKAAADFRYIVVLTDGEWYSQDTAIKKAKKAHNSGIEIIAIGFGDADYGFLRQIASADDFASFTSLSELSQSFSKIAQVISGGTNGISKR